MSKMRGGIEMYANNKIVLTLKEVLERKYEFIDFVTQYDYIVLKDDNGNQLLIITKYVVRVDVGEETPQITIWTVKDTIEIDQDGWG